MKTVYFALALIIAMMMAVSCKSAPKGQGDSPVQEMPVSESPPQLEAEPPAAEEIPPEIPEEVSEAPDEESVPEEPVDEEPILAEADEPDIEEFPPVEEIEPPVVTVNEPEPPVVAVVPEPAPPPPPPREIPPPQPVSPPPPVVTPPPAEPPPVEEPPPPVREPLPRIGPELPNPTPAFRGRPDEEVVFSRTVRATVGQLVVVPFRGTNWVYLGEIGARRGIAYDSRRLDPEGQSIIFRTEAAGEYALKFSQQNLIRDFILNDYVKVIVSDPPETAGTGWFGPSIDRGRVVAEPRWPSSLEEAQALRADTRPAQPPAQTPPAQTPLTQAPPTQPPPAQTPPAQTPLTQAPPAQTPPAQTPPTQPPPTQTPSTQSPLAQTPQTQPPLTQTPPAQPPAQTPPDLAPEAYLQKAKEEFDAGRVAAAIACLDQFSEYFPMGSDEALWLYGQFYEANSPSRNILTSLDYYRRLMQEYPQSSRYDDARRRMAYLQRYYINIQ